jgi:hypothetical protein
MTIVLDRVGATDQPLALPGDLPGPHSKEAYDLSVTEHGVRIHAQSSAGIFYGIQTLRQLIEGSGSDAVLPQVEIHDWPSVELRGTMVHISHRPLPTEKEIERELDFLARWKENQYYPKIFEILKPAVACPMILLSRREQRETTDGEVHQAVWQPDRFCISLL